MSNYPLGARDDSMAPYNREIEYQEVEVTVSLTCSKSFKLKVAAGYEDTDLYDEFVRTHYHPQELAKEIEDELSGTNYSGMIRDCLDWNIDELEVVEE